MYLIKRFINIVEVVEDVEDHKKSNQVNLLYVIEIFIRKNVTTILVYDCWYGYIVYFNKNNAFY